MSADWIKMRVDLKTHPKTVRISSALSTDTFRVVGGLHAMWSVFDRHTIDGLLTGYTLEKLDEAISWPGFSQAVVDVDWLMFDVRRGVLMPEFIEHNGQSAKRRAEDQKRKRNARRDIEDVQTSSGENADKVRTETGLEKEKEKEYIKPIIDSVVDEHFPTLWAAYPARPGKSKANALKQYRARIREGVSPGQLLAGVTAYAAHCQRTGLDAQFIKQPETFLGKGEHYLANWEPVALTAAQTGQTLHERMNDRGWADPEKTNNNEHAIEGTATHIPEGGNDADRD